MNINKNSLTEFIRNKDNLDTVLAIIYDIYYHTYNGGLAEYDCSCDSLDDLHYRNNNDDFYLDYLDGLDCCVILYILCKKSKDTFNYNDPYVNGTGDEGWISATSEEVYNLVSTDESIQRIKESWEYVINDLIPRMDDYDKNDIQSCDVVLCLPRVIE